MVSVQVRHKKIENESSSHSPVCDILAHPGETIIHHHYPAYKWKMTSLQLTHPSSRTHSARAEQCHLSLNT